MRTKPARLGLPPHAADLSARASGHRQPRALEPLTLSAHGAPHTTPCSQVSEAGVRVRGVRHRKMKVKQACRPSVLAPGRAARHRRAAPPSPRQPVAAA
eukprot:scaffold16814_cov69-Phaeocystis_antarctica.AAC.15